MRYFLDTEYNGFGGELIAIALVPEDDSLAPFYEAIACRTPTPWVAENVLPVLGTEPITQRALADRFADYLINDPDPLLVADWPEDIAHACMLLVTGPGLMKPIRSIRFELVDPRLRASDPGLSIHRLCALAFSNAHFLRRHSGIT
jgi:hypothetical protein